MDRFRYNLNSNTASSDEPSGDEAELEIYVHNARNIHNICIYENQDVYAKFSLTYDPDRAHSTRIVPGGGKNPDFDESLRIKVSQPGSSVLKCEIWMLSRVRSYLEDQLLGFALVPISQLSERSKLTQDYSLSSTDLFHSPAGTVRLTLSLNATSSSSINNPQSDSPGGSGSSISSEVVLLDPGEYSRIEFPDISVVRENQKMVSEYFDSGSGRDRGPGSFLCLGACPDYEMTVNSSEEEDSSGLSEERNSAESTEKKKSPKDLVDEEEEEGRNEKGANEDESDLRSKQQAFSGPIVGSEAEQSEMQKQIVDMYMRSMQQFTESLAKMKLPMEIDKVRPVQDLDDSEIIRNNNNNSSNNDKLELEKKKKKDGSRVFYGSRAFF